MFAGFRRGRARIAVVFAAMLAWSKGAAGSLLLVISPLISSVMSALGPVLVNSVVYSVLGAVAIAVVSTAASLLQQAVQSRSSGDYAPAAAGAAGVQRRPVLEQPGRGRRPAPQDSAGDARGDPRRNSIFALGPPGNAGEGASRMPGDAHDAQADQHDDPPAQPGAPRLMLRLNDNVDFRSLRYTLEYQPDAADALDTPYYLHHARFDGQQLELVQSQQIQGDPTAWGWRAGEHPRLCEADLRLDRRQPRCQGVMRVAAARARTLRTSSTPVHFYATPQPIQGPDDEPGSVEGLRDTLHASRDLDLKEAFFAAFSDDGIGGSAVYMVARDPRQPGAWTKTPLRGHGTGVPLLGLPMRPLLNLELSRDASRLYLSSMRELSEWTGSPQNHARVLLTLRDDSRLGDIAVLDRGVCVLQRWSTQPAAFRCLTQGASQWDELTQIPLQPRPRANSIIGLPAFLTLRLRLAANGNSLLIANMQWRETGEMRAFWVPDVSVAPALLHAVSLARSEYQPGRQVFGVLPVSGPGDAVQHFVMHGVFPGKKHVFQPVTLIRDGRNQPGAPDVSPGASFGAHAGSSDYPELRAVAWTRPGAGAVRIFSSGPSLMSTHYGLRQRKQLLHAEIEWPRGWRDHLGLNLLRHDDGTRTLVTGGHLQTVGNWWVGLMLRHVPGFMAPPGEAQALDFSPELRRLQGRNPQSFIAEHVTSNALLLSPAPASGGGV